MGLKVLDKIHADDRARSGSPFIANVWNTISTQYQLELDLRLDVNTKNSIYLNAATNTLTLTSGSWTDLIGAYNGANIDFKFNTTPAPAFSTTVVSVNGADMVVTSVGPNTTGSKLVGFVQITDTPKDFEFSFNLVKNSVGSGTSSLIDGNDIRFRGEDIDLLSTAGTSTKVLTQLGNKSGGSIFTNVLLTITNDTPGQNLEYTLDLQYKVWSINGQDFFSSEALGEYIELTMEMISGDPSTAVITNHFQAGNTGFEGENFNGGPSDYTSDAITWEDLSSNTLTAFDYTQQSEFTLTIYGNFDAADEFNIVMFTLPETASDYQNKPNPIENNLMLAKNITPIPPSTPTNIAGNLNDSGAGFNLLNVESTINPGVSMTITGIVDPNSAFTTLFNTRQANDRKYKILIDVQSDLVSGYSKSNAVNILADFQDSAKNLTPLGKITTVTKLDFEDHASSVYVGVPNLYLEDDVLVEVEYTLPKDNTSSPQNPWVALKGRIIIENNTTGEVYKLEEFIYQVSQLPVLTDGTLPLNYIEDRGFKLPDGSDKKEFIIEREPLLDTPDVFGVRMKYPFIVRYEDWLQLQNVPVDFYNTPNSNWYNFASDPNWKIKFEHAAQIDDGLIEGEYIDDQEFTINSYDDWGETPGSSITFEREDGTPINKPSGSQVSVVKAVHSLTADTFTGNEYVQVHVRPKKGAPQYTGSTVLDWTDLNNPLYPLSGETKTTIDVVGGTITSEVRFDPSKIDTSNGITFTSRVKGDSIGGEKNNIFLLETSVSRKPFVPGIGDVTDQDVVSQMDECRGIPKCCDVEKKFADLERESRKYNCYTGVYLIADTFNVVLKKNGLPVSYSAPSSTALPNDPDARMVQLEWRDVANSDGFGLYTVEIQGYFLNSVLQTPFVWGEYDLKPYCSDGLYNREGTSRMLSLFNDVNDRLGIDFTGSGLYDSLIIEGKFGYNEANTEINNTVYLNGTVEKVRREDFDTWELRTNLISQYFVDRLRFHVLGESYTWLSDNNATSPSYQLFDVPVIVSEGYLPEYFDGSRLQKGVVKYEDKVRRARTHFKDNRITADTFAPPQAIVSSIPEGVSSLSLKTGKTFSYLNGDDGFHEFGRGIDFFTMGLDNLNPYGGQERFTDTDGLQVYGNGLVCDWRQWDRTTGEFVMYRNTVNGVDIDFPNALIEAATLVIDGFTNFRVMDDMRIDLIMNKAFTGTSNGLNYTPFSMTFVRLWSSTSNSNTFTFEYQNNGTKFENNKLTGTVRRYGVYRVGNTSELNI